MTQTDTPIQQEIQPPPAQVAQAVLVLGMHRSGTSALARVLNLLGVELGSDLLPPAADNEMGFWEHRQVQFIHDRIYEVLKADWTHVSALPARWWTFPEIEPYRQQLRETLLKDFGNQMLWGVKDPRICAMLPLWRPLLAEMNVQPRCVLICRNPTEVAKSLGKRDGLSAARVYLLWLRSIIDSEAGSRGLPRVITTYDQVLADWAGEASRISLALDVAWPKSVSEITDQVHDFLRPSVRHHCVNDEHFLQDEQIPALVRRMYAAVLKAVASGQTEDLSAAVDTLGQELDEGQPLLLDFIRDLQQEQRGTVIEKNLQTISLGDQTARTQLALAESTEKSKQNAELQEQFSAARVKAEAQIAQLQAQLAAEQRSAQQAAEAASKAAAEATAAAAQAANEKQILEQQVAVLQRSLTAQIDALARHRAEADRTQSELQQYQIQRMILLRVLDQVKQTRAWRWGRGGRGGRGLSIWPVGPLTEAGLIPVSSMRSLGPNRWACDGVAEMALPCLPIRGKIAVSLHLTVSVPGHARLYFDSGHLFNGNEYLDLGPVEDEILITTETTLENWVHCFRLDPLDRDGTFTIHRFEIKLV